jgi:rhamnulokinase
VAAIPATGESWAYLSSGTWSIVGVESPGPIINAISREYNFTNEVGFRGSIRFLKNIPGLWIVQECRRELARRGREYTYEELTEMAEAAPPLVSFIDPMDPSFGIPDDMHRKIEAACRATNQPVPTTPGEIVRCVLESLALLYRRTFNQLEEASGRTLSTLHIVGGGSKNRLLNQLTANSTGRVVLAGPTECSAMGNVLVQAIALGHIPSLAAAREIVRASFPLIRYEPVDAMLWESIGKQLHMPARG